MSFTDLAEYYVARVVEAQDQAAAATLGCVRDRCLRSAAAWNVMAMRSQQSAKLKETNDAAHFDRQPKVV